MRHSRSGSVAPKVTPSSKCALLRPPLLAVQGAVRLVDEQVAEAVYEVVRAPAVARDIEGPACRHPEAQACEIVAAVERALVDARVEKLVIELPARAASSQVVQAAQPRGVDTLIEIAGAVARDARLDKWLESPAWREHDLEHEPGHEAQRVERLRQTGVDDIDGLEIEEAQGHRQGQPRANACIGRVIELVTKRQLVYLQRAPRHGVDAGAELRREAEIDHLLLGGY